MTTRDARLPEGFMDAIAPLLGNELGAFLASYQQEYARGVRFRDARRPLPPMDLQGAIPYARDAYYLRADSACGALALHEAGAYYIQEPSAMAAAAALAPGENDVVLDLCAAPGGKSTQLARFITGGTLVANEPVPARAQVLSRNIERMGIRSCVVTSAYPEQLAQQWPQYFDKILVDAPCSGEGMFRRHPEARAEWHADAPVRCAQRQLAILRCAARMLRAGGRLAYSTCTFNALENEGVLDAFLREHPHFARLPFALPGLPEARAGMLRLWPHKIRGEGHFVALLQKTALGPEEGAPAADAPLPAPDSAQAARAMDALGVADRALFPNACFAGRLVCAPRRLPELSGIKTLRVGLHMAEVRGKVCLPDHALALAAPVESVYPLTHEQAALYLHGEALPCPDSLRGFVALTLDSWQLGFGKASEGMIKNHYPKGLRK